MKDDQKWDGICVVDPGWNKSRFHSLNVLHSRSQYLMFERLGYSIAEDRELYHVVIVAKLLLLICAEGIWAT